MTTNPESSSFVFSCCQAGAENVLKSHVLEECPAWRLAFSRRGFVTFKVPEEVDKAPLLRSAFARTFGLSIGQVAAGESSEVKNLIGTQKYHHLHVWPRDHLLPGDRGWMPGGDAPPQSALRALLPSSLWGGSPVRRATGGTSAC